MQLSVLKKSLKWQSNLDESPLPFGRGFFKMRKVALFVFRFFTIFYEFATRRDVYLFLYCRELNLHPKVKQLGLKIRLRVYELPNQRDPNQFFFETFREPSENLRENSQRTFREPSENLFFTFLVAENLQRTLGTRFRELCGTDAGSPPTAISIMKVRTPSGKAWLGKNLVDFATSARCQQRL